MSRIIIIVVALVIVIGIGTWIWWFENGGQGVKDDETDNEEPNDSDISDNTGNNRTSKK